MNSSHPLGPGSRIARLSWFVALPLLTGLALSGCCTTANDAVRSEAAEYGARHVRDSAESAFARAMEVLPITQIHSQESHLCVLRAGNVFCKFGDRPSFSFERTGPVERIARWDRQLCVTLPGGTVECQTRVRDARTMELRDPEGTLSSAGNVLCAFKGSTVTCEIWSSVSSEHWWLAEVELPQGSAEVVSLHVESGDFARNIRVAILDRRGAVYLWRPPHERPKESSAQSVERLDLPPLRHLDIDERRWAGVTLDGELVFGDDVRAENESVRTLCGVEDVSQVQVFDGWVCALTSDGIVCDGPEVEYPEPGGFAVGPPHERCNAPRGPRARQDIAGMVLHDRRICFATVQGQILCDQRSSWSTERPVVFRESRQITSGAHFVCALGNDGRVRCQGPGTGSESTSEVDMLRDANRIVAGDNLLCGVFEKELRCAWLGSPDGRLETMRWVPIEPLRIKHELENFAVSGGGVTWTHNDKLYQYELDIGAHDSRGVSQIDNDDASMAVLRPIRVRPLPPRSDRIKLSHRNYYVDTDGFLYVARQRLDAPGAIFGLVTGGLGYVAGVPISRRSVDRVLPFPNAVELVAGKRHACVRLETREVACVRGNGVGQATGRPGGRALSLHSALHDFEEPAVSISAGDYHSCALFEDGRVRCWGRLGHAMLRPDDAYPEFSVIDYPE